MKIRWSYLLAGVVIFSIVAILVREIIANDGVDEALYDFAVSDTASVSKIVIWDKSPDTVRLDRKGIQWMVNGQYIARHDAIEVILETLYRVRLRNFPQTAAEQTILSAMATYGKRVEVYQGDELVKSFIVGTETPDMLGTYMLMDGYEKPVATYIPGFNGYLSSRFFLREDLWRSRELWPNPEIISTVSLVYPDSSLFEIQKEGSQFLLVSGSGNGMAADPMASQALFKAIQQAQYEGMIIPSDIVWGKRDSIVASIPVVRVIVRYTDQSEAQMDLYHVPGGPDILDGDGNPQLWDPDRFYAVLSDGRFVLAQRYGLQHVLKSFRAFLPKNGQGLSPE
ncbi:MAG: hypothetical protein P8N56_01650 [Schleiferiaceae bacterium]|nr:hypothetical protein [Schleiferiaceae bacterium]